jgi:hypothetical protein
LFPLSVPEIMAWVLQVAELSLNVTGPKIELLSWVKTAVASIVCEEELLGFRVKFQVPPKNKGGVLLQPLSNPQQNSRITRIQTFMRAAIVRHYTT